MSAKEWLEEFYPVTAGAIAASARTGEVGSLDVIRHSLVKWKGLRPETLAKHGLKLAFQAVKDEEGQDILSIDSDSCSLCKLHTSECWECEILTANGCSCIKDYKKAVYGEKRNVEPMIALLERTLEAHGGEKAPTQEQNLIQSNSEGTKND